MSSTALTGSDINAGFLIAFTEALSHLLLLFSFLF